MAAAGTRSHCRLDRLRELPVILLTDLLERRHTGHPLAGQNRMDRDGGQPNLSTHCFGEALELGAGSLVGGNRAPAMPGDGFFVPFVELRSDRVD